MICRLRYLLRFLSRFGAWLEECRWHRTCESCGGCRWSTASCHDACSSTGFGSCHIVAIRRVDDRATAKSSPPVRIRVTRGIVP